MRARPLSFVVFAAWPLFVGCAHHGKNQYAFAPPYAPPVYPQPASFSQAPAATMPPAAAPVGAAAPPAGIAAAPCPPPTTASAAHISPCPPGEYIVGETVVSGEMPCPNIGEVIVADGQSPPCPPGP